MENEMAPILTEQTTKNHGQCIVEVYDYSIKAWKAVQAFILLEHPNGSALLFTGYAVEGKRLHWWRHTAMHVEW